jgi:hypothetical protein
MRLQLTIGPVTVFDVILFETMEPAEPDSLPVQPVVIVGVLDRKDDEDDVPGFGTN